MEQGAFDLYTNATKTVKSAGSKQLLKELAQDELRHREYFEKALKDPKKVLDAANAADARKTVKDLGVTDPLLEPKLDADANYQDTLLFAIKSEKTAHDFYAALAGEFEGNPIAGMWRSFAQQEAGHKQRLEKEYDDYVLSDN